MADFSQLPQSRAAFGALVVVGMLASGCQERTQATLDLSTDLSCSDITETAISVGEFPLIERTEAITTSPGCLAPDVSEIGTLAVAPPDSDSKTAEWGVRIVTAVNAEVSTCQPPAYGPQCIVARRSTRFIDGRAFTIPIPMRETCLGVLCPESLTCVDGTCRHPDVNPDLCLTGNCEEDDLELPELVPWRRAIGGAGNDIANDLEGMLGGDAIIGGSFATEIAFSDPAAFPESAHESAGVQDGFIARVGPSGEYRWSRSFGGEGYDAVFGVHATRVSVIIATGTYSGSVDFGEGLASGSGDSAGDGFAVAYGGLGAPLWAVQFSGAGRQDGIDAASDRDGNIYVLVRFAEELEVSSGASSTIVNGDGVNTAIVKLDATGEPQWIEKIGGIGEDVINDIVVDDAGNVYVAGGFEQSVTIDDVTITSKGNKDVLIASFDSAGALRWTRTFGNGGHDLASSMSLFETDDVAEIAIGGALRGAVAFDGNVIGDDDTGGFALRLNLDGEYVWSQGYGSQSGDSGAERVAYDRIGRLTVSGFFGDRVSLTDDIAKTGRSNRNAFVALYDGDDLELSHVFIPSHFAMTRGVAPLQDGSLYVFGSFATALDFDGAQLSSVHGSVGDPNSSASLQTDIFVGRIPPP